MSLSQVMQYVPFNYARWAIRKLNWVGHMFKGRYKSIPVEDQNYLINLCRYIHLNPVSANMVKAVGDYPGNSHGFYQELPPDWLEVDLLKMAIKFVTGVNYSIIMCETVDYKQWQPSLYFLEKGNLIVNDSVMQSEVLLSTSDSIHKVHYIDLIEIVCEHIGISLIHLHALGRSRDINRSRALVVYYLRKYTALSMKEVSGLFGRTMSILIR